MTIAGMVRMKKIAGRTDVHHNNGIVQAAVIAYPKKCCATAKMTVHRVPTRQIAAGPYAAYCLALRPVAHLPTAVFATVPKGTKSARKTGERV